MLPNFSFRTRLKNSLDVAERCIPILGARSFESNMGRQAFKREKFVAETAILLYAAFNADQLDSQLRNRCYEIGHQLRPLARSDEILALMRLRQNMIPELSVGHVCLTDIGISDEKFDEVVSVLLLDGYRAPERAPWKDLEADWLSSKCKYFPIPSYINISTERTTLATGLDALTSRREEIYAFTHAAIYMTDFGRKIIKAPRELAEIIGDAEAALSRCIDDDDFDLCAEILMTWPYFRSAMSQTGQFCLRVLANVEDEVGFLPSLTIKVDEIKDLQADKRLHKLLDETYHTVYVMGLLSAAMMNGQWLDYPATTPRSANIAKRLFDLLPHKKPVPQWEAAYAEVSDDVRNSLSHFIAAIALRRALLANNLGLVRDILIVCFDGNISGSPSIINSAKIIGRFVHAT